MSKKSETTEIGLTDFLVSNNTFLIIAVSLVYFLAHVLAFIFPDSERIIMLIWPAGGIGLAAFLLFPRRLWPVLADVFVADRSFMEGVGYMTGNMVESIGTAWLILFFSKDFRNFSKINEVITLIAGSIFINAISACIGAGTSVLTRNALFAEAWKSWYIADGLGMLLVGPFIIVWFRNFRKSFNSLSFKIIIESFFCILTWAIISFLIFFPDKTNRIFDFHSYYLVAFIAWPAIRFGQHGVTLALIILFIIAIVSPAVIHGPSPWTAVNRPDNLSYRLIELQIFLVFLAIVGYLMAAAYENLMHVEKVLKESKEKYKNLAFDLDKAQSVAKIGSWKWTIKNNLLYWSPGMYAIFGISEKNFTGKLEEVIQQAIHPDDRAKVEASNQSVIEKGIPIPLEYRIITPDGSIKTLWAEAGELTLDNNSEPAILTGIVIDITERKKAENELIVAKEQAEENALLNNSLLQTIPFGIDIVDQNGVLLYQNDILKKLAGDNDLQKKCWEIYRDSKTQCEDCPLHSKILPGNTKICEVKGLFGDRIFEISHTAMKFQGKNVLLEIFIDITQRKQFELELIKAKEHAEESDHLKTAFLQNMSHEIRTPMNAIMGFSELLARNYNNKEKLEKFSDIIIQRCNDLLDIINDLLDIAKIESGQTNISNEKVNINILFNDLKLFFTALQNRLGKRHITFRLHAGDNQSNLIIETDSGKLKQILTNLIGNAFKFTESGSIEVGCKTIEDNILVFHVSDSGIGIPLEKQKNIFERFVQLEQGNSRIYGGTGLGLSIVKGLVGLLGGKLWLESIPENKTTGKAGSTTFYFSLPLNKLISNYKEPDLKENNKKYDFGTKTVLIVEDDTYNADLIKEILAETTLKFIHTNSGKEAVKISTSQPVDLILMDIRLPDIDGYEATAQIKQKKPLMKIIAQTAYASQAEKLKSLEAGCNDFIGKPTNRDLLLALISEHLSGQGLQKT
jgi:PAS domain S-box-containing protein